MKQQFHHDAFFSAAKYLQAILVLALILYFGKILFVPLLFGLLIAFVTYPVCQWLEHRHWSRSISIAVVILFVFILFISLFLLLIYELNITLHDLPRITGKLGSYSPDIRDWLKKNLGIAPDTQANWIRNIMIDLQSGLSGYLKALFNTTVSTLFLLVMIPVYASLFLYHRGTFVKFLESVAGNAYRDRLHKILHQSIHTYFHFVKGTFFVYLIVGVLNSTGLLLLGIDHAILYGMLTAFMTIIPYIGIIISASIPVTIALVTRDSVWYPLGVILIFSFVQYLEANVIFPRVVGVQLNLSTWATLVAIVAGTILWGVAGMILFIPMLAILKIVSEQVDDLKPINILLDRKNGYKPR